MCKRNCPDLKEKEKRKKRKEKKATVGCERKLPTETYSKHGMCKMLVKPLGHYYCPRLTIKLRMTGVQP